MRQDFVPCDRERQRAAVVRIDEKVDSCVERGGAAAAFAATAVAIVVFWIHWFASDAYLNASPPAYCVFKNASFYPEGVLAVLLALTAAALLCGLRLAIGIGLLACGMLWAAAAVDFAASWQNGRFITGPTEELFVRALFVAGCFGVALWGGWKLHAERYRSSDGPGRHANLRDLIALVALILLGIATSQWGLPSRDDFLPAFREALLILDVSVLCGAVAVAQGIASGKRWAPATGLALCGSMLYRTIFVQTFAATNSTRLTGFMARSMCIRPIMVGQSVLLVLVLIAVSRLWSAVLPRRSRAQ